VSEPSVYPAVMRELTERELLLKQDKTLSSVVTMIAGGPLSASWWGHPRAREIFACLSQLADDPFVLVTKLVSRKVTFVHRKLWPAVLTVATAGEPWQFVGLSPDGRKLLEEVQARGAIVASGKLAAELETRLLVHGEQVHTESGVHRIRLESWDAWSSRQNTQSKLSPDEARARLNTAVRAIGGTGEELPWRTRRRRGA
jgi:hypothetical protein